MKIEQHQWESAFFGREIYRAKLMKKGCDDSHILADIDLSMSEGIPCQISPTPSLLNRGSRGEHKKDCLIQAKLPTTEFTQIAELQQLGFQLVETEITFSLALAKFSNDLTACDIRFARESDLLPLKHLVSTVFLSSRFREPYFTQAENQRFYQTWIENAVKGEFDDLCLVAEKNSKIQGVISLRFLDKKAKIGLLAVSPEFQRQGIAKRLLSSAISQAKAQQAKNLEITTQLSNMPAIQFYQSFGAKITETNYWFYR